MFITQPTLILSTAEQNPKIRESNQSLFRTCDWEDVPVANGGHGDNDPVEGGGDGGEARVLVLLNEVGQAAEDQPRDADQEDEEAQLLVAVLQRVGDGLLAMKKKCSQWKGCFELLTRCGQNLLLLLQNCVWAINNKKWRGRMSSR